MNIIAKLILGINRWLLRFRKQQYPAKNVLLLLPHCLHYRECKHNVRSNLDQCVACGRCDIAEIIKLRDEFGIQCSLVGGGREAVAATRRPEVKIIIAVACEKELAEGVRAAFPKPVITIPNIRPEGYCNNTRVDLKALRTKLQQVVIPKLQS